MRLHGIFAVTALAAAACGSSVKVDGTGSGTSSSSGGTGGSTTTSMNMGGVGGASTGMSGNGGETTASTSTTSSTEGTGGSTTSSSTSTTSSGLQEAPDWDCLWSQWKVDHQQYWTCGVGDPPQPACTSNACVGNAYASGTIYECINGVAYKQTCDKGCKVAIFGQNDSCVM